MCVAQLRAGDASGTGLFDPAKRDYDPTRLASIDSELHNKFPELITPNEVGLMVLQYSGCRCGLWCWPGCTSRPNCGSQLFCPMALSGLQLKWSQNALPAMAASCTATPDADAIKEILARAEHAPIIGAAAPVAAACTELRGPAMA